MKKFKVLALAALMLAGVGCAGLVMTTSEALAYPSCGGCWPD